MVLAAAAAFGAAWAATPSVAGLDRTVALRAGTGAATAGEVAPIMREAVVATEDERFYQHRGVDLVGVLRALPYDVTHLSLAQGASTITEQLAKLAYLGGNDHTPWRKLEDVALAVKIEDRYTKEQILSAYLATAYFDGGSDGVAAASRRFFGIPPARLDLAQASLLAGLVQAPSAYDPVSHPAAARARQVEVLRALVRNGYATTAEARQALALPLRAGTATLPPVAGVRLAPDPRSSGGSSPPARPRSWPAPCCSCSAGGSGSSCAAGRCCSGSPRSRRSSRAPPSSSARSGSPNRRAAAARARARRRSRRAAAATRPRRRPRPPA